MKIKLYQIGLKRDKRNLMFIDYARTRAKGGIDAGEYEKVFEGSINSKNLDEAYKTFNILSLLPKGYRGRSMSISDVIVTETGGAFFVDRVGFRRIEFDERLTHPFVPKEAT